jgi:hypothetical protein
MIDRTDPDETARTLEHLFPNARFRSVCVAALADSITAAHAAAPNGWGVTLFDALIRLNVGKIEVMSLHPDWIYVILDSRSFPEGLRSRSNVELTFEYAPGQKGVFRSVPVSVLCGFPADAIGKLFPLLKQSHVSLIRAAADTALNPAARVGYSPAVVKYLSAILGRHFEHPMYYSEKETKEEKEESTSTPKAKKKTSKRKPKPVLVGSVQPDDKLAVIVGSQPLTREELTIKLWDYIKKHGCWDKKKRAMINADDLLEPVFNGKSKVSMSEMAKLVSTHLR